MAKKAENADEAEKPEKVKRVKKRKKGKKPKKRVKRKKRRAPRKRPRARMLVGLLTGTLVLGLTVGFLLWVLGVFGTGPLGPGGDTPTGPGVRRVPGAPSVTIFFTCDLQGRLVPCNCEEGSLGGVARMATLCRKWRDEQPDGVLVDVGNAAIVDHKQAETINRYTLRALEGIGHTIVNCGDNEAALSLDRLVSLSRGTQLKIISANLVRADTDLTVFPSHHVVERGGLRIAFVGLVRDDILSGHIGKGVRIRSHVSALKGAISSLKDKADLIVVLAYVSPEQLHELAERFKEVDVFLGGYTQATSAPYEVAGRAIIAYLGDQGCTVGRLEAYFPEKGPPSAEGRVALLSKRVADVIMPKLGENIHKATIVQWLKQEGERVGVGELLFEAVGSREPAKVEPEKAEKVVVKVKAHKGGILDAIHAKEKSVVRAGQVVGTIELPEDPGLTVLVSEFTGRLAGAKLPGADWPLKMPCSTSYVGSDVCKLCHLKEFYKWQATKHAGAYVTLLQEGRSKERECFFCHTTGLGMPGGYDPARPNVAPRTVKGAKATERKGPQGPSTQYPMAGVGCECCHGGARRHLGLALKDRFEVAKTPQLRSGSSLRNCRRCHNAWRPCLAEDQKDLFEMGEYTKKIKHWQRRE